MPLLAGICVPLKILDVRDTKATGSGSPTPPTSKERLGNWKRPTMSFLTISRFVSAAKLDVVIFARIFFLARLFIVIELFLLVVVRVAFGPVGHLRFLRRLWRRVRRQDILALRVRNRRRLPFIRRPLIFGLYSHLWAIGFLICRRRVVLHL